MSYPCIPDDIIVYRILRFKINELPNPKLCTMSLLGLEDDYVDSIPDYGLSTLQSQFRTKRLGEQYKKYEQRILVSKLDITFT